jgi:hypothetical protein
MNAPNKIDYSKLLGFGILSDELENGVDFKDPCVAAKLGAKVGSITTKTFMPSKLPSEAANPGAPVMQGLGGRKVSGS